MDGDTAVTLASRADVAPAGFGTSAVARNLCHPYGDACGRVPVHSGNRAAERA